MDISQLNKEEKIRLYEALQEKKRRLRARKPMYSPNEGQLKVHQDMHPLRLVTSGNGSGKSTLLVNEVWWAATGHNPIKNTFTKVPARIAVILDSPQKIEDVFLPELRKWYDVDAQCEINKKGRPYPSELVFKNGSKVTFLTHLQEPLALEGVEFDYAFFDEPPPRPVFLAIMRGNRRKGSKFGALIIGTPVANGAWLYEDLYKPAMRGERDDVGVHRYSTAVNAANLGDGYIDNFSRNLTEKEKRIRLEGEFFHLEGLALAHMFDREKHVVPAFPWPQGKPVVVVIDPHPAKPSVACMVGATGDGRIYYLKEMSSKSPPAQFAQELKEFYAGYRLYDCVIDSLGETPGSGGDGNMSFSEKLRQCGVPVRSTTFDDKKDADFIARIKQVLETPVEADNWGRQIPKLAIVEGQNGIIEDIESVAWLKYRNVDEYKPRLDISNKDYLACLKYALATNILFVADIGKAPKIKRPNRSPWSGGSRR